jgi:hypothetical protein
MTYDKKKQFDGWIRRDFRYVRRALERFWRKELDEEIDDIIERPVAVMGTHRSVV